MSEAGEVSAREVYHKHRVSEQTFYPGSTSPVVWMCPTPGGEAAESQNTTHKRIMAQQVPIKKGLREAAKENVGPDYASSCLDRDEELGIITASGNARTRAVGHGTSH
jgi:hypothetical protein